LSSKGIKFATSVIVGSDGSTQPTAATPYWGFVQQSAILDIGVAADSARYGLTSQGSIPGVERIIGGAVIQFTYPSDVNVSRISFSTADVQLRYGIYFSDPQYISATLTPEPGSLALIFLGGVGLTALLLGRSFLNRREIYC
jgi:hypothetical protein